MEGEPLTILLSLKCSQPISVRRTLATVAMEAGGLEEVVGRLIYPTAMSITGQRYALPSEEALRPAMLLMCDELNRRVGKI